MPEKQGDGLPEVGIDRTPVLPDVGEGRVVGLAVYQPDKNAPLCDGEAHEGGFERFHQLGIFFLDNFAPFRFFIGLCQFVLNLTDFGGSWR